jgi:hypothetical protein
VRNLSNNNSYLGFIIRFGKGMPTVRQPAGREWNNCRLNVWEFGDELKSGRGIPFIVLIEIVARRNL